jgi:predicted ribosome quality control (RQC) complex YloA/Tae2 family protein
MLFDSLILAAVTDELGRTIVGGKVEKITQPSPLELVLRVYHAGQTHYLLLSCDPTLARVHLTQIRRDNPPQPPAFCSLLRKYLDGAWVHAVSLPLGFGDRVLHIEFRAADGATYSLIAETMGRLSNLVFVNSPGTILGAAKHIGRDLNRFRQIQPGLTYAPPPRQRSENREPKRDPLSPYDAPDGEAMSPDEARAWLMGTFMGISPLLAREVVVRVQRGTLTPQTLWYSLSNLLSVVRVNDWTPRVWSDDRGVTQGAYPVALLSVPISSQFPRDSISVALDNASSSLGQAETFERGRDSLIAALRRSSRLREREQQELMQGIKNAERAEEYQQSGDLLLANQGQIQRGQHLVEVLDYYAPPLPTGEPTMRFISLDPTLSVHENAERFFRRSQKARRSAQTLQERRDMVAEELALLELAERETAQATAREQIARIRESMANLLSREERYDGEKTEAPKPSGPAFEGHKIKTFRSVDGWEILVGENATSNDYLTTRVAASSDIWLHVRAATSAHGVIRAQNRPGSVSPAALQHAAELVAARSEVKHSSLIPVDYTLKKYVRKPRKSAAGAVTYQNEKTLYVNGIHG